MRERAREALAGREAWVVGGAVRDELLGRPVVDLDIATRDPAAAARAFARRSGGAPFPLSERHGAWRVALPGERTVDFTPLADGIESDLATRDFTVNAMAQPLAGGDLVDPFGGRRDLGAGVLRAVAPGIFEADPLRLLRAVRLEDELGLRLDAETERLLVGCAHLVWRPAGERILGELRRLRPAGWARARELGLVPDNPRFDRLELVDSPEFRLVCGLGERLLELPISRGLERYARTLLQAEPPPDRSPRSIHRLRRRTEPWTLEALAYVGAPGDLADLVREARVRDRRRPLVRGDELGLPPGPEVGRLLELIEEEVAAGTITSREQALELARRRAR